MPDLCRELPIGRSMARGVQPPDGRITTPSRPTATRPVPAAPTVEFLAARARTRTYDANRETLAAGPPARDRAVPGLRSRRCNRLTPERENPVAVFAELLLQNVDSLAI